MTAIQYPRRAIYYNQRPQRLRGFRGLGQCPDDTGFDPCAATGPTTVTTPPILDTGISPTLPNTTATNPFASVLQSFGIPLGTTSTPTALPGAAQTTTQPINWASIINNLIGTAGKATTTALSPFSALQPGTVLSMTPQGTVVSTAGSGAAQAASAANLISAYMPLILLAGGAVLLFVLIEGGHKR